MALILSIETSTSVCSVALHNQGRLIAYESLGVPYSHAESLLQMITHVIQISHSQYNDLEAVALSEGPGSYTGLRIGAATAMGLAYALDIPLIAVNTLSAMVLAVTPFSNLPALYCPMIDARRMEVYCLVADAAGAILEPVHAHVVTEDSFANFLQRKMMFFFGDGSGKCKPLLEKVKNVFFVDDIYPSAQQIGRLAYEKFQKKNFADLLRFHPLYLKGV